MSGSKMSIDDLKSQDLIVIGSQYITYQSVLSTYTPKRSQPDDLLPLCKYLQFTDCEKYQFLKQ